MGAVKLLFNTVVLLVFLVLAFVELPPLVEYFKNRVALQQAFGNRGPTWNDVAKRLADFQKEQPGFALAGQPSQTGQPATDTTSGTLSQPSTTMPVTPPVSPSK